MTFVRPPPRSAWYARMMSRPVISPHAPAGGCSVARAMPVISQSASSSRQSISSAPWAVSSGCKRMQPLEPRERGDGLGDLRVVLHGARAQRVEAGVHAVVHLREPRVVAHQIDLGHLGQPGLGAAPRVLRDRHLRHVKRREPERRATRARPIHDRALPRRGILTADRRSAHASTSASACANRSISSRERFSVTATASARPSASASGTPARNPRSTSSSRTSTAGPREP